MVIGVSGKMGSGKNEVANMLSYLLFINPNGTYRGYEFQKKLYEAYIRNGIYSQAKFKFPNIHSFAENLKKCTSICTGIDYHLLEDRAIKESEIDWLGLTHRQLLQWFGEAIRRQINENFWILSMFSTYSDSNFWIISDVRYKNEAEAIREKGGFLIRLLRLESQSNTHISETDLDDYPNFDVLILNDSSLESLFEKVKELVKKHKWENS